MNIAAFAAGRQIEAGKKTVNSFRRHSDPQKGKPAENISWKKRKHIIMSMGLAQKIAAERIGAGGRRRETL
ncbi:hypothetical protein, partial [Neisseria meningitidis]|uniref:hypothetical protein n=1 Tax=Neisseria meningitidis TaxID=487 RepID=UPI000CB57348